MSTIKQIEKNENKGKIKENKENGKKKIYINFHN